MADIADILKRAKPPERFEDICLDGDLKAEHRQLEQELHEANRGPVEDRDARRRTLAEQIHELEGRMQAATVRFRLRGMSAFQRDEWLDANPAREGKSEAWNPAGEPALVAACCVDPQMTVEDARELRASIGGDWDRLTKAAWEASTEGSSVPFSFIASAILRTPSEK